MTERFYGKYRGMVIDNLDPMNLARIKVQCADVLGVAISSWAMPCVPVTGIQSGVFVVPPIGANVWMEFEAGDPDFPIWSGGFWGIAAEVPAAALQAIPARPNIVLQSNNMNAVIISDLIAGPKGGITLQSTTGAFITVNDTGIYIDNGKGASINLIGPATDINKGALTIT